MKTVRVILTVLVVIALATGTVLERLNPTVHIYDDWWFIALLALTGIAAIVSIVQGKMWHRLAVMLVHASVPVILLGGALTFWTGQHGSMTLQPRVPSTCIDDGWQLPFSITLESFEVIPYNGTHTPMDFVSHVTVDGKLYDISMNHILRYRGYRFYQEDYGEDGSSTLSVAHDPWGIPVCYTGFALLLIGLLWLTISKLKPAKLALILMLLFPAVSQAAPRTLPKATASKMGEMYVLYKGRVCPLQTFAKDFTTKLTGSATYQGLTAEQVLSGYLFYFDQWADEPAIKHSSYMQLLHLDTMRITPQSDKKVRASSERYNLVKGLLSGKTLKLFPIDGGWYAQNDILPMSVGDDEYLFVRRWQGYCQELVMLGDYAELERVFGKTLDYQRKNGVFPSTARIRAERLYNAITIGRWLAMLAITLGLVLFGWHLLRKGLPRWVRTGLTAYILVLTSYLILILVLRWIVGAHAPMAGGFDSMNLMAIVIGIVGLIASFTKSSNQAIKQSSAVLAMGFCLLVAMMSGSNPPVTSLMPVLNSPLLTLHVAVIMCSYALFFFVMLLSLASLLSSLQFPLSTLLRPAVFLLALGIVIGAVWANISWGNYWSWDPKEVWALMTLIVYALPLHRGVFKNGRALYLYCTLAFLCVVITYFGVNLLLGGLHSYN